MVFSPSIQKIPVDSAFNMSHTDDEAAIIANIAANIAAQVDDDPDAINLAPSQGKT